MEQSQSLDTTAVAVAVCKMQSSRMPSHAIKACPRLARAANLAEHAITRMADASAMAMLLLLSHPIANVLASCA